MTQRVHIAVMGHWSQSGNVHESQVNGQHCNFLNVAEDINLWEELVKTFMYEGQSVLISKDDREAGM